MADANPAVLLVGAGRMGSALLRGWLSARGVGQIHLIEPLPSASINALAAAGSITLRPDLKPAGLSRVRAIVLAMKPQAIKADTALLRRLGALDAPLISIAAGITTSFLAAHLGGQPRVIRAMPNTPGSIGRGITVLCAGPEIETPQRELAAMLMSALGETLWLDDEALLDAVTAISGSGPAYVFLLAEALAAAGREQGLDPSVADRLARYTVSGAGALLETDNRPATELRRDVTSPGGTTEAALNVLDGPNGLRELVVRAVAAATERGKALGKS
jgi:pyrroline-5-carboxylate reductase